MHLPTRAAHAQSKPQVLGSAKSPPFQTPSAPCPGLTPRISCSLKLTDLHHLHFTTLLPGSARPSLLLAAKPRLSSSSPWVVRKHDQRGILLECACHVCLGSVRERAKMQCPKRTLSIDLQLAGVLCSLLFKRGSVPLLTTSLEACHVVF